MQILQDITGAERLWNHEGSQICVLKLPCPVYRGRTVRGRPFLHTAQPCDPDNPAASTHSCPLLPADTTPLMTSLYK